MKNSRERTILIAVLSLAGGAFLVDRVFLGSDITGPAESSAGVLGGFETVAPPLADQVSKNDQVHSPGSTSELAKRLREVSERSPDTDPAQGRDAFTPAEDWSVGVSQVLTDNNTELVNQFLAKHHLNAVMIIGDRRCAMIDGRTLFVGQELDGYKLETIYERSAVFQGGGLRVKLGINSDPPPS